MNKLILGTCLLAALSGCGKDDAADNPGVTNGGVEVKFNSGVSTLIPTTVTTRGGAINTFIPRGEHVGIYGIPAIKSNPDNYTIDQFTDEGQFQKNLFNANYEVMSGSGTTSVLQQQFVAKFPSNKSGYDALSFYGYYPYTDTQNIEDLGKGYAYIPIRINKDNMTQTNDYLYTGQYISGITTTAVNLPFKHALAKLVFRIYASDLATIGKNPVRINSITVQAYYSTDGYMDLRTGEITPNKSYVPVSFTYPLTDSYVAIESTPATVAPVTDFLVVPGDKIAVISCSLTETKTNYTKEYVIYDIDEYLNTPEGRIIPQKGEAINVNVLYTPRDVIINSELKPWVVNDAETRSFFIDANK